MEAQIADVRAELLSLRPIKPATTQFDTSRVCEVSREIPGSAEAMQQPIPAGDIGAAASTPSDSGLTTRLLLAEAELRGLKAVVDDLRLSRDAWQVQAERATLALTGLLSERSPCTAPRESDRRLWWRNKA
jgi:hypothetical protein